VFQQTGRRKKAGPVFKYKVSPWASGTGYGGQACEQYDHARPDIIQKAKEKQIIADQTILPHIHNLAQTLLQVCKIALVLYFFCADGTFVAGNKILAFAETPWSRRGSSLTVGWRRSRDYLRLPCQWVY